MNSNKYEIWESYIKVDYIAKYFNELDPANIFKIQHSKSF